MRLLIIAPNLPRPAGGASTRNYYLLKALATDHDIALLALIDATEQVSTADQTRLEQLAHSLTIVRRPASPRGKRWQQLWQVAHGQSYIVQSHNDTDVQGAIDTLVQEHLYDAVLVESVLMAGYRLPEYAHVIIDQHNIEYEILERTYQLDKSRLRRWYNRRESQLLKPVEIERCRQANALLMTSDRERLLFQALLPEQLIETIPNGVDITYFVDQKPDQTIDGRIIFTGAMNYYPNINGVLFFAQHCWPLIRERFPTASWQIVGREPPEEVRALAKLPGVEVTGAVPDTRPYIAQAAVAIAPLQIGSGTRLKILEGLAMHKAMVTTSIGCEGLEVRHGEHILVADQPILFAEAVCTLLQDPQRRLTLGSAGRTLVEQRYSWELCSARLLRLLEELKEKEHICL